jgi:hypothetical protein
MSSCSLSDCVSQNNPKTFLGMPSSRKSPDMCVSLNLTSPCSTSLSRSPDISGSPQICQVFVQIFDKSFVKAYR